VQIKTYIDRGTMSRAAARHAAGALRNALTRTDNVRLVAATGVSQIDFLSALTAASNIEWTRVEMFHLDEYVGVPVDHPASFRKYLLDRLIAKTGIRSFHLLDGERDATRTADQVGRELARAPADLAFVGIGENGHLAFNDPPADFATREPYLIVSLDEACRRQQVGEGWFATMNDVPTQAITISIAQILDAREIVCVVPDARKAEAVRKSLKGPIDPMAPAAALQKHSNTTVYLDKASSALL
jgi:glucosamine-6-phosphate deaminase